jgi:hypothetical protein
MSWEVEYTDEFETWWTDLSESAQDGVPPFSSSEGTRLATTSSTIEWFPSLTASTTDTYKSLPRKISTTRTTDMAKKFNELRAKMLPGRQRQNKAEAERTLLEMTLQELRQNVTSLSQDDIAEILRVTQGYISKLERQDDMLLSRLYAYVEALGGELEIRAKFPNREVQINQYREVDKLRAALAPVKKHKESA